MNEKKTAPEHPAPASEIGSPPQEAKPVDAIPNQPATERELAEVKNDLSGVQPTGNFVPSGPAEYNGYRDRASEAKAN